jgi:hypothetical protein
VASDYIWGGALAEWGRVAPAARLVNLEMSITRSDECERKGINYRMHPDNIGCLRAAHIDICILADNASADDARWIWRTVNEISGGFGTEVVLSEPGTLRWTRPDRLGILSHLLREISQEDAAEPVRYIGSERRALCCIAGVR